MVLAGQKITFSAFGMDEDIYMPGWISGMDDVDVSQAAWTASAGTPTTGTGSFFEWTAPDAAASVTVSVTAPDAGNLADDRVDAEDETSVSAIVPTVVRVYFVDYRMRDTGFAETDDHHTWDCCGWYYGDLVDVPQYDATLTPPRNEPVYMVGGDLCSVWLTFQCTPGIDSSCDIEVQTDWGSLAGINTIDGGAELSPGWGAFEPRPQQVDKFIQQEIKWSYKVPPPYGSDNWIEMNTTTHNIYQSYDHPCGEPLPPAPRLRVHTVCSEAEDEDTIEGVADDITEWVRENLHGWYGGMDPEVDPWCYFDAGADTIECDDQAQLACDVLALLGVSGNVALVRASTDRCTCLQLEHRYCDVCHAYETLVLFSDRVNWYEGCCHVDDGDVSILYALWSSEPSLVKAKETDVTNNPPSDLAAAALSMVNNLTGFTQVWRRDDLEIVTHWGVPKPPLD